MDWLEKTVHKWIQEWKKASLKKSLSIYILAAIFGTGLCSVTTSLVCDSWRMVIYTNRNIIEDEPVHYIYNLSGMDETILECLERIQQLAPIVYAVLGILLTAHFYYKNKIAEPIQILKEEIEAINRNDLSLGCVYTTADEMGDICSMVNQMRLQLIEKQDSIWSMMEGQRQLNSAFAHDIRTPLTVMQGYTELLVKYYPEGKISEEKLINTLTLLEEQVIRLKNFTETMKGMNRFDELSIKPVMIETSVFHSKIEQIMEGLRLHHAAAITLDDQIGAGCLWLDESVVFQVLENLLSNALSYCIDTVEVRTVLEEEQLVLYVKDNGCGFTEKELFTADRPYYCGRQEKDQEEHYGLGLSICRMLCEKHGGKLSLCNSISGGAIVCASFYAI